MKRLAGAIVAGALAGAVLTACGAASDGGAVHHDLGGEPRAQLRIDLGPDSGGVTLTAT